MANPQPEPFVKFSKELFDALLLSPMPATHKEIVLAVIRRTYGDHGKKVAPIAHSLIRRMTGRADSGIRKSMGDLEREGVLVQVQEPTFRSPALWMLNKDYEQWGRWSVEKLSTDRAVVADRQELADQEQSGRGDRQSLAEESATTVAEGECHHGGTMEDKRELENGRRRARARGKDQEDEAVENLTRLCLDELPASESTDDDYRRTIELYRPRLPDQHIRRIILELGNFRPKRGPWPKPKVHLVLDSWLDKELGVPMPPGLAEQMEELADRGKEAMGERPADS